MSVGKLEGTPLMLELSVTEESLSLAGWIAILDLEMHEARCNYWVNTVQH